jgi:DNA-binding XRE family transcriptional regulator
MLVMTNFPESARGYWLKAMADMEQEDVAETVEVVSHELRRETVTAADQGRLA